MNTLNTINKSKLISILETLFRPEEVDLDSTDHSVKTSQDVATALNANPDVQKFLKEKQVHRGDVLHVKAMGDYRNEGKFMYDGLKIVDLDYTRDEYGAVPAEFKVIDEFPIRYWTDAIEHNGIVHFNVEPRMNQILANLTRKDLKDPDLEIYESTFDHNGTSYRIIFTYQDDLPVSHEKIVEDLNAGAFSAFDDIGFEDEIASVIPEYDSNKTLFVSCFSGKRD